MKHFSSNWKQNLVLQRGAREILLIKHQAVQVLISSKLSLYKDSILFALEVYMNLLRDMHAHQQYASWTPQAH